MIAGHGAKLPRRMETAIVELPTQATLGEAAKHAGIKAPILWCRLQDPSFQTEYRKARRQAMG